MKLGKSLPKVIALDYYDGANEGFACGVFMGRDCYFKLVAWDSEQERRLYAVIAISRLQYERVASLLESAQGVPSSPLWIPRWEFSSSEDEREVDELVLQCKNLLIDQGALLLARQIDEEPTWRAEVAGKFAARIAGVLDRGVPDDLELWPIKGDN